MTKIKAVDVAKLRKQTGAGMMDCKKALVESNGSFDDAITILRKKGQKVAAKRADREAGEGIAVTKINDSSTSGVAIVLACETDFVAKNDSFKKLAEDFAEIALNFENKSDFLSADFNGMSVSDKLIEQTGVIGEKIEISAFERVDAKYVGSYTHGIKIAVLVGFDNVVDNIVNLSKDVAMQVASMGATTLSYKDFDMDFIASETEARIAVIEKENIELSRLGKTLKNVPIYISMAQLSSDILNTIESEIKEQLRSEGKPEHIWDKIVPGKIERFISDNTTLDQEQCLLDQKFIKDENQNVDAYIKSYGETSLSSFKRVSLGS
jgi:elongation factor Ts